jgi:hypothetical protein
MFKKSDSPVKIPTEFFCKYNLFTQKKTREFLQGCCFLCLEEQNYILSAGLPEEAEYPVNLSEDLAVVYNDGLHGVVFRLKADVTVLFVEGFYGCRVIDEGHYHVAVFRCAAGVDKHSVPVQDTGIDHGFTPYIQNKGFAMRHEI